MPETWRPIAGDADTGVCREADQRAVDYVLAQSTSSMDGRSEWLWLRLPNGDLVLGVFPQGDTYFATEWDHSS